MGKASIVYVVGLSMILAYSMLSVSATSTSSMDNYTGYYGHSMAHDIAITAANIGTSLLLTTPTYHSNLLSQKYSGGYFDLYVDNPGTDSATVRAYSRIVVSDETIYDTVIAAFKYTPFSKYGWLTDAEVNGYSGSPYNGASDWKITGDSVYGAAHTNGHFNLGGTPYFNDKVTATNSPALMSVNGVQAPVYKSGYQWGITVTRSPSDLTTILNDATSNGLIITNKDAGLTFFGNGKVNVRIPYSTGASRNDTLPLSTVAPNGVICDNGGDLYITGTYKGKVTVASLKNSQTNKGNVWINGNGIVANTNPNGNDASPDMMGIVSEYSTYITQDLTRNTSTVVNIQAAVYCKNGELTAQNFWTIPKSGRVVLFGGVQQHTAGSLGVFSTSGLLNGFNYTIRHDVRFNTSATKDYPVSPKFQLISWWEN